MRKNNLKTSAVSRLTIKWCRALFATFKDISRKQVRGVGKSATLAAERYLDSNLDYYREGWNNKLRSLFGM